MKVRRFRHIPQLDGVRAIAVLLVMMSHAGLQGKIPGGFGVTIFFFLSGYLITSLLRAEMAEAGRIDLKAFYFRRVLRIMPPLYLTLVLLTILYPLGVFGLRTNWPAIPWDYLFLSNYSFLWTPGGGLPVPLWSLAVEEHFYLLFPVLFMVVLRRGSPERLAAICAGGCALALLLRCITWWMDPHYLPYNYYWTHTRIDSILFGCCLALYQNPLLEANAWRPKNWQVIGAVSVVLGSFALKGVVFRETIRYTFQGLALFVLFSFVLSGRSQWLNRALTWKPVTWIGLVSYTLYLCHFAIYAALRNLLGINAFEAGLIGFPLACLYAQAMRVAVELPILKWRRRHSETVKSMVNTPPLDLTKAESNLSHDVGVSSFDERGDDEGGGDEVALQKV